MTICFFILRQPDSEGWSGNASELQLIRAWVDGVGLIKR